MITLASFDDEWLDLFERRVRNQNKRARRKGIAGVIETNDLARAYLKQRGLCLFCEIKLCPDNVSVEHVLSLANGGANDSTNVALSCDECNNKRAALDDVERNMGRDAESCDELLARLAKLEEAAANQTGVYKHPNVLQNLHYRIQRIVGRLNQIGVFV